MKSLQGSVSCFTENVPTVPYQNILTSIIDVICLFDKDGIFQYVSPASKQLFGYEPEEMAGRSFRDFIHPDDIPKTVVAVDGSRNDKDTSNFQNRYVRKDGSVVLVIWSRRWIEADGLFYGVARDGSEKAEIELRLQKAQEMAGVANYEFDLRTQTYNYASDTMFQIFGLDRSKNPVFTSAIFWSLIHPDDVSLVKKDILSFSNQSTLEYRIVRPDGEVRHVTRLREIIRDEYGVPLKTIGTIQDITARKIIKLALQQSEEKFRSLVQHSNDLLAIIDKDGVYKFVAQSVEILLAHPEEKLLGTCCFSFVHPDDLPTVRKSIDEMPQGKSVFIGPYRFKNAAGEWRWLETIVSDHLENPAIGGLVVNARDITEKVQKDEERKLVELRMQTQNQTMVEVLEQMQEGFVTMTLEGKIIYWNKQAEIITGSPRERMLGNCLWDLYPGIRNTDFYKFYQPLFAGKKSVTKEVQSPYSNRWTEIHAYRTQNSISVFFRDITSKKIAEEEWQKLSLIARQTNNPVIIQDPERRVQWVNNAFIEVSGYTMEECLGKHVTEICDGPETDRETLRYVQEKLRRRESFRIEALNYKKNGDTYWSDVTCQPIFNEAGELVQYFSIATDITERKRLERQLEKEQKERQTKIAAATLKAQEQERSIVGQELHDNVNQVLTTVKLYAEMCRDGIGNTNELMEKSIQLLQSSITEIRSLSKRLSAPSLGKIRLSDSIKELIAIVDLTKKLNVELNTAGIQSLEVNQEIHLAVYRILQEHLTNILKHADANQVVVTIEILVGHLHVYVKDNGKGFDTRKKSNGIGITNMVTRAESLQGSLRLNSSPGAGCELHVMIPLEA
ncbi:MAG TPA: PAS domain S-box protein [Flavisolibacter sp.]|nr:PAS domain S-box protein [Flavisolibacter sp.]